MANKTALITGITGQDGAYLAELLLNKNYRVHGLQRRSASHNTDRIDHLSADITLHYGDMTDATNLVRIVSETQADEIYNLAAQSHVQVSFETPEYTANTDALGTLRLLEAIRILKLQNKTRFYQASSSELYGAATQVPQNETTPFAPRSPYAAAKLYAYWITVNYREAYNIFASNGILFNHESPLRGEDFVTRKITKAAAEISLGLRENLTLGNLNAQRDWGHAKDYVQGMWKILQHSAPDDFVLATGQSHSVRDFATLAFAEIGIPLNWAGQGVDETASCAKSGKTIIRVNPAHFRPTEVGHLIGDASKAKTQLGWSATTTLQELIKDMVQTDIDQAKSTQKTNKGAR